MSELHDIVTYVVALNEGGKVVGKTRLQKMVFLLDQCGLKSGCSYDYHYYGPFSAEIAEAAEDAYHLGQLNYEENPGFYAVPYGVYEIARPSANVPEAIGGLERRTVEGKLNLMGGYSAIELELAATLQYLQTRGFKDAAALVKELKPAKATPERLTHAQKLLRDLGL